ncbi:prothoracicotropic hormone-like [Colletes gigas]|uniref:prothoracicotropic hormone-like n=1 Tax=Colletes gigas TaxID=935657 RepID=UPI001C9B458A|nr:prothoracicotropic hormone-like [Colletes gigas]
MMVTLIFCIILSQLRLVEMTFTRWPRYQEQPLDNELSIRRSSKPWNRSQLLGEPLNHLQQLLNRPICSCETQYGGIIDLGDNHYPRFLSESYCKPQTVQRKFPRCKLLNYTVHVLQAREGSEPRYLYDSVLRETKLPERFRYDWQLKPIQVGVACIPDTGS